MKKTITQNLKVFMTLCLLLFGVTTSWAEFAPKETVLWAETFAHFGTKTPSAAGTGTGTTIYGGASITYSQSSTNTKGYDENLAGGTKPELLLSKSSQTWTISGIATGKAKEMTLSFLSNKTTFSVTTSSESYSVSGSQKSWTFTLKDDQQAPETFDITIKNTGSSNARIDNVKLVVTVAGEEVDPTSPVIVAQDTVISADTENGVITFSINNPKEGSSLSVIGDQTWFGASSVQGNKIFFTVLKNETNADRVGHLTLKYDGAKDKVVTITQKGKPFDTIESMYVAAVNYGSTARSSTIKFGNWVVSGVAGNNAYVTDGTNGFIIYENNHGFKVGDILSGTVTCSLLLYKNSAELKGITSETEGLTVTTDGTVTPKETTIDKLSGLNTGAVIVLKGVNYDGTNFTDGINSIQPYKTFMTLPTFDTSKKYNVTGVYIQFDTTKEIAPRSEDDIEEVTAEKYSITVAEGIEHGTVTPNVTSAIEGTKVTLTIEPKTHYELSTLTITDSNGANVEYNEADYSFIMPAYNVTVSATFAESAKYYVIYTSLGEEVGDGEEVYAGECIAKAPEVTAPEGWEFAGWTADETFTTSTAVPTYFTDETPVTQDTILYAVFSKTITAGSSTGMAIATLSNDSIVKYIAGSYNTGSIKVGNDVWEYNACTQTYSKTGVKYMQIRNNATTSYVKLPDFNSNIVSIMLKDVNNGSNAQYTGEIYFRTECDNNAEALVVAKTTEAGENVVLNIPNGYKTGYIMSSAACRFTDIVVTLSNVTRIYSTTTVFDDYTRDGLAEGNLGTICLESDALVEGAQAYEVSLMTMNGDNISSITFSPVEKVEGGKGYLFVASGSELTAEYISEAKTEAENNGLVGSLEGTDVDEGKYIINNNKVKKCGTGCSIAANRAYIDPTKYVGELLPAKGETITIELETPTSINELMQKVAAPGQWYNLNGQPVAQPTKGVFTKNGVKYIFK